MKDPRFKEVLETFERVRKSSLCLILIKVSQVLIGVFLFNKKNQKKYPKNCGFLSDVVLDVVKIIARHVYESRYDKIWEVLPFYLLTTFLTQRLLLTFPLPLSFQGPRKEAAYNQPSLSPFFLSTDQSLGFSRPRDHLPSAEE